MSASLTPFLNLLFKFKNKLPVLSRVKLPYILGLSKDITENSNWVNQLEWSLGKCTMHYCLLDIQSVVCSSALLICFISLLRRTSLSDFFVVHIDRSDVVLALSIFPWLESHFVQSFALYHLWTILMNYYQIYQDIKVSTNLLLVRLQLHVHYFKLPVHMHFAPCQFPVPFAVLMLYVPKKATLLHSSWKFIISSQASA